MNTKQLKSKILDLAIHGKLVPQDSSEGNATDLLQKIKKDKNSSFIIKAEDGRHHERLADGTLKDIEDDIPFEIPENWCWCRLKDFSINYSVKDSKIQQKEIKPKGKYPVITQSANFTEGFYDDEKYLINTERRNVVIFGDHTRNVKFVNFPFVVGADGVKVLKIEKLFNSKYIYYLIWYASKNIEYRGYSRHFQFMETFIYPLPPLAEQERIVSAIEKAFEQIDIIEKNKLSLKNYIKQTKSKVLDLAIHGKLVGQNPQEGNAFELLEKIRNEKAEQVRQKKIKADKEASFIIKAVDGRHYEQFADNTLKDIEEDIPFEILDSWCWTKLKCVSSEILYGVSESAKKEGKYKLLRITDIQNDKVDWEKVPFTNYDEKNVSQYLLNLGDLVFARTGTVGKSFLINQEIENAIYASYLIRVRPSNLIDSKFIKYYFQSKTYWDQIVDRSLGNGRPNVNGTSLANLYLPIPPLAEQQRIVKKVEQIFAQLDELEENLER